MARSTYDSMTNPIEVSARVQACDILGLDYKLEKYTADDGDNLWRLNIPELDMASMFASTPLQLHAPKFETITDPEPEVIRQTITEIIDHYNQAVSTDEPQS